MRNGSERVWVRTRDSRRLFYVAIVSVTLVLGGITAGPASAKARERTTVTSLLNTLPVAVENNVGYDRSMFRHWITTDGCSTREWVLIRQTIVGELDDCIVVGGKWFSRYDGKSTTVASGFDIDHMVPLAEAWGSGAATWTSQRRQDYANDLSYRPALIAVTASSNRSKGDRDPAEWLPPSKSYWCKYLRQWVGVKYRWGLSVDPEEKAAISEGIEGCAAGMQEPALG
ncbi:MAG: HNH endonuclease family protein [bacterium]|nr:HNH endonuclease family protein [bacterium]